MIATTVFFIVVGIILAIVIGVNLATDINEPELYFMFWLMYIITVATLVNIGMSIYYYLTTKDKRGPRSPRGNRGDPGTSGPTGKCDPNCRERVCSDSVLEQMTQQIRQLSGDPSFQKSDIRNVYLLKTIRRICGSPQFKQLAPLKGPTALIEYIKGIWSEITRLLYEEGGQRYFKTVGAEQTFDWRNGKNPWSEFKKYGVYYWGLDKQYRPKVTFTDKTDGTVPSDAFEALMDSDNNNNNNNNGDNNSVPSSSILGFINADSNGEIMNITTGKPGTYIIEASMAKASQTVMQKYGGKADNSKSLHIPPMTYMVRHPSQPDRCLDVTNKLLKWRLCDPYRKNQYFKIDWTDMSKRQFRLKAHNSKYLVGNGSKFQVVDTLSVGNEYRFQEQ